MNLLTQLYHIVWGPCYSHAARWMSPNNKPLLNPWSAVEETQGHCEREAEQDIKKGKDIKNELQVNF